MRNDAALAVLAALGAAVAASWALTRRWAQQPGSRDFSTAQGGAMANAMNSGEYRAAVAKVAAAHPVDCGCQICALAQQQARGGSRERVAGDVEAPNERQIGLPHRP